MRTTTIALGSLLILGVLAAILFWKNQPPATPPLIVWAAAATRPPMEAIAADFERETDRHIELRYGASEDILTKAAMPNPTQPGDLFLPADDSYIRLARERNLVAETLPVASMKIVVLTSPGNPKEIKTWNDLVRDGVKVAVPAPAAAAGKRARDHLAANGKWAELQPRSVDTGTVTEAANAAKVGSADAAIVWDAVAANYPGQTVLMLPELDGVVGKVEVAVLSQSRDAAAAKRFAQYMTDPAHGLQHFQRSGFHVEPTRE